MSLKIKNEIKTDKSADKYQEIIQIIETIPLLKFQLII
jgi:hypothetical protein